MSRLPAHMHAAFKRGVPIKLTCAPNGDCIASVSAFDHELACQAPTADAAVRMVREAMMSSYGYRCSRGPLGTWSVFAD